MGKTFEIVIQDGHGGRLIEPLEYTKFREAIQKDILGDEPLSPAAEEFIKKIYLRECKKRREKNDRQKKGRNGER